MRNPYDKKPNKPWYGNHHYESDNEGIWAVFLDSAGIKYVPHPATFKTGMFFQGSEIEYTPDFYLCDYNVYCEVKGSNDQLRDIHFQRRVSAAMNENHTPVAHGLLILGPIGGFRGNETKRRCIGGDQYYWRAGAIRKGHWIIGKTDEQDNSSKVILRDIEDPATSLSYPHLTNDPHVELTLWDNGRHASEIIYEAINNAQFAKKNGLFTYEDEDEKKIVYTSNKENQEATDFMDTAKTYIPEVPFD